MSATATDTLVPNTVMSLNSDSSYGDDWSLHQAGTPVGNPDVFFSLIFLNYGDGPLTLILNPNLPEVKSLITAESMLRFGLSQLNADDCILASFQTLWAHVKPHQFKLPFPVPHIQSLDYKRWLIEWTTDTKSLK